MSKPPSWRVNVNEPPYPSENAYLLQLAEIAYIAHMRTKAQSFYKVIPWHKLSDREQYTWVATAKAIEHFIISRMHT